MHESLYKAGSGRRYQAGQGHPGRVPRILATVVAVIALIVAASHWFGPSHPMQSRS